MPRRKGQKVRSKEETKNIIIALEEYVLANGETTFKELLTGPGKDLGLSPKKPSDKITIPKWLKKSKRIEWKKKGRSLVFFPPETAETETAGAEGVPEGFVEMKVSAPVEMFTQVAEIADEYGLPVNDVFQVLLHFGLVGLGSTLESHSENYTLTHGEGREFTPAHSMRLFVHQVKGLYPLYAMNEEDFQESDSKDENGD